MNENIIDEIRGMNFIFEKEVFQRSSNNPLFLKNPCPLQASIVIYLYHNRGVEISQKDLQEKFQVSKAAISDTIGSMEKKGILKREVSLNDARRNKILLTDLGVECYEDIEDNVSFLNHKIIRELSKEEVDMFYSVIGKMKKILKEENL